MDYRAAVAAVMARGVEWEFDPTLDRIRDLLDLLGEPQRACPVILVAGTNGKSSVSRMIDALLTERGLRVGRFTSPHLSALRERIAIDGEPLSEERFAEVYADIEPYLQIIDGKHPVRLSFFETLTAMAYSAFADAPVDVAVVEIGMGGAWDATNVVDPAVAVVTPIGLDHTEYLGDTLHDIALEKAGIIKAGSVAVIAQQPLEAAEVLLRQVAETGARVVREGIEFGVLRRELAFGGQQLDLRGIYAGYDEVFLPLFGEHQAANAAVALAAVEVFASGAPTNAVLDPDEVTRGSLTEYSGGDGALDPELVRAGFARVSSPGRLEVVRTGPTVILDSAHNPAGMAASVAALSEAFGFNKLVAVIAAPADKDVAGMLEELEPVVSEAVITVNSSPRSMPLDDLAALAESVLGAERVRVAARLDDAIDKAVALADEEGEFGGAGVIITGSVVTAGDARVLLRVK
ncbi:folylpolyglutamate synthase/dihydrofolate synthase family protein [Actinocorallia sp. A-T 12471]|uniref:bifunctional folylpolyglutamate synthase/dihydrofolate synthase n=1 Tax=Actinocorallia sp. A-T 12471 TaxID=3089813 RepID=UPI0029CF0CE9|nr:folylpolyglutamate synthase/dihydrofolate synthase family protein [Actinocorallia sp. A-T 12471]MDX6742952.1 folylpolyglutamate synthase/dihydrofolate synthase family protein [Actinocorallia sp. A-T 12471]